MIHVNDSTASGIYTRQPTKGSAVWMVLEDRLAIEEGTYPQKFTSRVAYLFQQRLCASSRRHISYWD